MLALVGGVVIVAVATVGLGGRAAGQTTLRAGKHKYVLEAAVTPDERQKGLGGRTDLPTDHGMLFLFSGEQVRCFWMKDMHFPIDMIWLDSAKEVVHIESDVSPDSYPHEYCPDAPARYVVELRAGQARAADIRKGQTLTF